MAKTRRFWKQNLIVYFISVLSFLVGSCDNFSLGKEKKPASPNLLVITLDTTRADRLGCYGYKSAETPNLDQLAEQGVRFDNAYSQIPITLPSHATLFTGLYPPEHGIRDNGSGVLGEDIPTVAEIFADHGYKTGAFVAAAVLDHMYGLERGFETYSDRMEGNISPDEQIAEIPADRVCDRALNWLEKNKKAPFFCWVHFYDPHTPHRPPSPYLERHKDKYDGEIAFMDSQIGRLKNWLDSNGLRKNTLVIAVADHGESLGEHGESTHSFFIYGATIHVPMIFTAPGWLARGKVVKADVGIVDILPTVLNLLGWEVPKSVTGRSFLPAFQDAALDFRGVYSESDYAFNNFGWGKLRSLVTGEWHLIQAPRSELYNMVKDPYELRNIYEEEKALAVKMNAELTEIEKSIKTSKVKNVVLDQKSREALESLGYLSGGRGGENGRSRENLKDPKEMIHAYNRVMAGRSFIAGGDTKRGIKELETALDSARDSAMIHYSLGRAYASIGDKGKAKHYFQDALQLLPTYCDVHNELGLLLSEEGNYSGAIAHYESALRVTPNYPIVLLNMANAKMALGKIDESKEIYRKILASKDDYPEAYYQLGIACALQGDTSGAVTALRSAVRIRKDYWQAWNDLGALLEKEGKLQESVSCYEAALKVNPENPVLLVNMANAKMVLGDFKASAEVYQKILELRKNDPGAYYGLGTAYLRLGKLPEAVTAFRQAVGFKGDFWQAYNDLADTFLKMGELDKALDAARRAVEIMPSQPLVHVTLAEVYSEKQMNQRANRALQAAVEKGFADAAYLRNDRYFKRLQGDPQFQSVLGIIEDKQRKPVVPEKQE